MKIIILISLFTFILLFSLNAQDISEEQYMKAFIVVSDTSMNYFMLHDKMSQLSKNLNFEIDTMGREYNPSKNLICLPENAEDGIYAGFYYPRRFQSESLSLEYLDYYKNGLNITDSTIALVVMITNEKEKAEEKLKQINKYSPDAFIMNSKIYIGCMH